MDTTGMSRAEVDRLRELAAKAHEEGQELARHNLHWPESRSASDARQWAEEELPYPTVTRPRVVRVGNVEYKRTTGCIYWRPAGSLTWSVAQRIEDVRMLASFLTSNELDEVKRGPCGPSETVEVE